MYSIGPYYEVTMPDIAVTKALNLIEIKPAKPVVHLLAPELIYKRLQFNHGYKARKRGVSTKTEILYELDEKNDVMWTFAGLLDRVVKLLRGAGFDPLLSERGRLKYPEPVWDNLRGVTLRDAQVSMLATMVSCDRGQLNGCTGIGKTFLITQFTKLYPHPDFGIIICAQQVPVVRSIYNSISEVYPNDIGKVGGGSYEPNRITVTTSKSLLKAPIDTCKVFIYDEVHTAAAPQVSEALIQLKTCRMFGMSASTECRSDKADLLTEALFGPVRIHAGYKEAQERGFVAQVDGYFYEIEVPTCHKENRIARKRELVWRNTSKNKYIAEIASHWEQQLDDPQIVIMTDTIEHVLRIGMFLPDYDVMYASLDNKKLDRFRRMGIVPDTFSTMSEKQKEQKQIDIENGVIRKVITTTTLGTGVDLRNLDVFIRADSGSSDISNVQFRGRVARGSKGVYCDFWVTGDDNEYSRSRKRHRACQTDGWNMRRVPMGEVCGR